MLFYKIEADIQLNNLLQLRIKGRIYRKVDSYLNSVGL